jgi:hypothetical protein
MPTTVMKQYGEHWEHEKDGRSRRIISVRIFHGTRETILHLCWEAPPGHPMKFSHLHVNYLYINVLSETLLLRVLATLTRETTMQECCHLLQRLGFTPTS